MTLTPGKGVREAHTCVYRAVERPLIRGDIRRNSTKRGSEACDKGGIGRHSTKRGWLRWSPGKGLVKYKVMIFLCLLVLRT